MEHSCASALAKALTTAFLAMVFSAASATNYYVAPTGNDANNGTSEATAWKTIDRVNQSAFTFQPGDKILFQRGGTYRGEVILGVSGTPSQPVTIGAYGTGSKPVIKGSVLVSGWSNYQGNIWQADVAGQVDQVYVNGQRMVPARFPNTGWLRNSQGGGTQIQSSDLTQPDGYWDGATAVVRSSSSSFDTLHVSNFSGSTLHFTSSTLNLGNEAWGFFMKGKLSELDMAGEWYFDRTAQKLYLWAPSGADPSGLTVEAAVYRAGVNCYWQRHDLKVQDIAFRHQRLAGLFNDGADHVTTSGCDFRYLYHGIRSAGTYDNCSGNNFKNTYATAAMLLGDNALIADNTFSDIALVDGEGESTWGYFGIRTTGTGTIIRHNELDTIGYIGIIAEANALVEKNIVKHTLATMNDGGGIAIDHADGLVIQDNIVGDPIGSFANGALLEAPHNVHMGIGIYFGNTSIKNTTAQRNTVYNCPQSGIHVDHTMVTTGLQIKDNVFFNNGVQITVSDYSNATGAGATPPYYLPNYNDVYSGNVMYCLTKDQLCMLQYNTHGANPVDFGTYSNNRYFNPYNELSIKVINFVSGAPRFYTLERWQAEKNEDAGSTRSTERLVAFATVDELSANLVQNGNFTNNVNGWAGWPNNAQVTHVTNHLDNGALKAFLPDNSQYPNFTMHNPDLFPIQDGAWYRVRCSVQSNTPGDVIVGIKGESTFSNPYTTWERDIPFDAERRDLEMYFQSDLTDQAQIQFINQWTEPMYYLDNVEVVKVSVQPVDPLDRNKLYVNENAASQSFTLPAGCWGDVNGTVLNGAVDVPAFSSITVFQLPDDVCGTTTGVSGPLAESNVGGLYPNPVDRGTSIHFAPVGNGRFTLTDLRGSLVMEQGLARDAGSMAIPASLAPGLYIAQVQGDAGRVAKKIVIR
ncbi:MAG: right-handed parallel beta-helix repeat-containing protein [Bacteroidetes bacterium]|nr:right-handed parallel beta-helix repeat-containing protein [Bacteroidota bacterium]